MQYLLTSEEAVRRQVAAAVAEAEGLGEVTAVESLARLREHLDTDEGSCVLVDEALADVSALAVVQEVARSYPLVPVILLARSRSTELLSAAMDAGARSVLTLPLSLEELYSRLQPVLAWSQAVREVGAQEEAGARRQGTVTAVVGAKGGVGTSTIAVVAAAQLAQHVRTCLVDLDVRGGDLAAMTGLSVRRSVIDLVDIAAEASAREVSEVMYPLPGGLSLLPAPEHGEAGEAMTEAATRQIISMLRYQFDHVVLDCGSRMDDVLAMALDCADRVLVVATPDAPALRSVRRLTQAFTRLDIAHGRIVEMVMNRSGRQREIQPRMAARMTEVPLAASVPDLTSQMDVAVNSSTLLTATVPALAKAVQPVTSLLLSGAAAASAPPPEAAGAPGSRLRRRGAKSRRWQRGQVIVEFPVVFALATAALLLCVQLLGYGVSYMMANHAAQEAAHAYGTGMSTAEVQREVRDRLPAPYRSGLRIERSASSEVTATVPVPSVLDLSTSARAGIVWEAQP
ncbi:response regulator [Actinomyces sp. 2119]|uniref:AAA family ATPase n=1 Tax=Actinomyces sp. 2119 TaxID=2321393 RepID=UPI000E6D2E98|nr:AAA family ATPase [Actinomyces sp. 2119]RJF43976.1 response regulator [Actinomyces sp. 2119]